MRGRLGVDIAPEEGVAVPLASHKNDSAPPADGDRNPVLESGLDGGANVDS